MPLVPRRGKTFAPPSGRRVQSRRKRASSWLRRPRELPASFAGTVRSNCQPKPLPRLIRPNSKRTPGTIPPAVAASRPAPISLWPGLVLESEAVAAAWRAGGWAYPLPQPADHRSRWRSPRRPRWPVPRSRDPRRAAVDSSSGVRFRPPAPAEWRGSPPTEQATHRPGENREALREPPRPTGSSSRMMTTNAPSARETSGPASAVPATQIAASTADKTSGRLRTRVAGWVNGAHRANVSPRRRNVREESGGDILADPLVRRRRCPGGCGPALGPTARVPIGHVASGRLPRRFRLFLGVAAQDDVEIF